MKNLFLAIATSLVAFGQAVQSTVPQQKATLQTSALPSHVRALLNAKESRYFTPGKERFTLVGLISDDRGGVRSARITMELPASAKFEDTSGSGKSVAFDGAKSVASANVAEAEYDLMETLYADSADYFFYSIAGGSANRFIGSRFRSDDGKSSTYNGPWLSVIQLASRLQFRPDQATRQKFYLFDAATKLLTSVRYEIRRGGQGVPVEIKLSGHTNVDGHMMPGVITRYEGGKQTLEYKVTSAAFSPKAADAVFTKP